MTHAGSAEKVETADGGHQKGSCSRGGWPGVPGKQMLCNWELVLMGDRLTAENCNHTLVT